MAVGIGIPDPILQEMIANMTITDDTLVLEFLMLIDKEIEATKAAIDFHKGLGMFRDNCSRWGIHLEVYERLQNILIQLMNKR